MRRSSTHGIPAFEIALEDEKKKFLEVLQNLHFHEFTTEEKLKEATENPKIQPKRATFDNIIQEQYYRIYRNGNKVHIHTGMIGNDFAATGTSWVVGIDKVSGKKIYLICPRNNGGSVLFRLSACAQLLKQIFDNRPKNTILVEVAHDVFVWRSKNPKEDDTPIDFLRYSKYLPKKERDYLTNRFKKSIKWIKDNPDKKRRRDRRGTYKTLEEINKN